MLLVTTLLVPTEIISVSLVTWSNMPIRTTFNCSTKIKGQMLSVLPSTLFPSKVSNYHAFFFSSIVLSSSLGGLNNQSQAAAGDEADLDVQFAFGITYPTNSTFFSTGGRPPYLPDFSEPDQNFNEPYEDVSTLAILVAVLFLTYFPSGSTTCCGILTPLKRSQPVTMTMNRPSHLPMLNVLVKALRNSVGKFHIPIQSDT